MACLFQDSCSGHCILLPASCFTTTTIPSKGYPSLVSMVHGDNPASCNRRRRKIKKSIPEAWHNSAFVGGGWRKKEWKNWGKTRTCKRRWQSRVQKQEERSNRADILLSVSPAQPGVDGAHNEALLHCKRDWGWSERFFTFVRNRILYCKLNYPKPRLWESQQLFRGHT